jgi:hypothetical protein
MAKIIYLTSQKLRRFVKKLAFYSNFSENRISVQKGRF